MYVAVRTGHFMPICDFSVVVSVASFKFLASSSVELELLWVVHSNGKRIANDSYYVAALFFTSINFTLYPHNNAVR